MPARRRVAKSCSRNWTGMSRRRASSPIGTGPSPQRPSSASACSAYGDFVVIEIIGCSLPSEPMGPVSRYAPPLAVMALIFALSATPDLSSGLGTWDLVLRKLAHVTIFAVLWLGL